MQTRREMLAHSATVAGLLATAGLLPQTALAAWPQAAFDAKTAGRRRQGAGRRRAGGEQGRHHHRPGHRRERRRGAGGRGHARCPA